MGLQLAINCHRSGTTGGGDSNDLNLKLEQVQSLLQDIKQGVIAIDPDTVLNANVDLSTIEGILELAIEQVSGKLDAIASTNNAIKLSLAETTEILRQSNLAVETTKIQIESLGTTISNGFLEIFDRWDNVFGLIKAEFDELQLLQSQTRDAQLQANTVITQIKEELINKTVEEIPLTKLIDASIEVINKVEVTIPKGAYHILVHFTYGDCTLVDLDIAEGLNTLFTVDQVLKNGRTVQRANIKPVATGVWDKTNAQIGSNLNSVAPQTVVTIYKSRANFTIEALYASEPGLEITVNEIEETDPEVALGEQDILNVDATPVEETPTETPPADEPPTDEPLADEPSTDERPADEPPTETPPADEPSADEPPAE